MPAYLIVMRTEPLRDAEAMAEYQRRTREKRPPIPLKPLVVNGRFETLEGNAPDAVVMLEFDSMEQARAWYDSEEYQEALPHRLKSADYQAIIVEGL